MRAISLREDVEKLASSAVCYVLRQDLQLIEVVLFWSWSWSFGPCHQKKIILDQGFLFP